MKAKSVVKGAPSGFVISLLFHAGAFLLAGLLVVFTVHQKEEKKFVPPRPVERPKMKLKKPKVKVKKSAKPKASSRIVTKVKRANMPDIQLPEMAGIGEGLSGSDVGGFDIAPDLSEISVFGGAQTIGNDFEGVVYSLLHTRGGGAASMGPDEFRDILRKYVLSGWRESVLSRYYRSPKKLYTTHFMVPPIPTAMAPGVFGVPDLEDYYLFIKYEGQLVHSTDIKFRFWAIGDAYVFINVDGEEVLMNAWQIHHPWFDWWSSTAGGDRTHILGNQRMVVGDWIELKAGEPLDMKVLYGEWHGGQVACMLLVEVEGEDYPNARTGGPLLPAFKTENFSWDSITEISRFLAEDECTLTNGPVFNDFHSESRPSTAIIQQDQVVEEKSAPNTEETVLRLWTMTDGKTAEAELLSVMSGNIILKNAKGRQLKIPAEKLSEGDRLYASLAMPPDLDINFAKTTKPRKFGGTVRGIDPPVRGNFYTFSARIKQTSRRPYGHQLTAEYFAVGDEIGGNRNVLLDHQTASFTLTRDNDYSFVFSGPPVELLDYTINNERRGKRYGGYLVVIKDSRGEIIAYNTPSEKLYENLENLRRIRVGWYFDDECNRCLPTPPEPWVEAGNN
ncbi:hypothetical protein P4B35_18120 [Pontiellaceae bacterium B12227]|nr:hypothetical protein [Pontiellaceae bacterium B12227]